MKILWYRLLCPVLLFLRTVLKTVGTYLFIG